MLCVPPVIHPLNICRRGRLVLTLIAAGTFCAFLSQGGANPPPSQVSEAKSQALCQEAQGKRETYFGIWKKEFLKRNGMQQDYFDDHVSVTKYDFTCWSSGISLRVEYDVTYDWAVIKYYDQFMVLFYAEETAYRHLGIKRDRFLDEKEIAYVLDKEAFSQITRVKTLEKLGFSSYEEALEAFRKEMGGYEPTNVRLSFHVPGRRPRIDGDPYLLGFAVVDWAKNDCRTGYMNLVTGKAETHKTACMVH